MGVFKPCFSTGKCSTEVAVLELYDEATARTVVASPGNPGFDDVLGEPYLEDDDDDQVGSRIRPSTTVEIWAKVRFTRHEEQRQYGAGNAPDSFLTLTISEQALRSAGLMANGKFGIRPNDRLLRLEKNGTVRVDFEADGRDGVYVFEVRPGETGSGVVEVFLEKRRAVAR